MEIENKVQIKQTKLFIDGKFVDAIDGKTFETIDPATEKVIAKVAYASKQDVDLAVRAARKAFHGPWRKLSAYDRGQLMFKFADLLEKHADEFAALESIDNGKANSISRAVDVGLTIKTFRYYAGWCDKIEGKTIPIAGAYECYSKREPIGVCGQIIPWNFPLLMAAWKLAPALCTGNTVILKPAEQTPLSALRLADLFVEAGFPPGVVNILSGHGDTGAALVDHPDVDKIAFTGSTEVGHLIMQNCSKTNIKKISLELGGKSANIVFDDVNVKEAVATCQLGLFFNVGQCCIAGSRVYVQEKIYDQFVKEAVHSAQQIKVGHAWDPETFNGPLIDKTQFEKVLAFIDSGVKGGAKLKCGGTRLGTHGYFIQSTVFADCTDNMQIMREEIFGPVMCITKFKDVDEVIQRANDTIYGLGAGVQTKNMDIALKVINGIHAGTVYVNCYNVFDANAPFGGFKESGFGKDLGELGLSNYLQDKVVIIKKPADSL